ncbi:MAG: right-handed parallel beta-helix repeat-containing protein [Candidatus Pacearchaeota archaeon]|nr:MAG: right-handed parallel beta-helix repeat-containing protein [Candidatus Pacearchaeota archaeon]
MKRAILVFVIIFLAFISLNLVSAATNVSQCMNLTNESEIYTLNQPINITGGDCLVIKNNSIVLDCQGHNITVNGADDKDWRAVDNEQGYDNITVKNCTFSQNFTGPTEEGEGQYAIGFINSINSTIFNNTFEVSGIFFGNSSNANITSNTLNYSGGSAPISLFSGSNSSVVENNNITTTGLGILVEASSSINISSNTITSSGENQSVIGIGSSSNISVDLNTIIISGTNATGIVLVMATTDTNITTNNITSSGIGAAGIGVVDNSDSNLLYNNTITTSNDTAFGIMLDGVSSTNIINNTITTSHTSSDGIHSEDSNSTIIFNNTVKTEGNESDGVFIFNGLSNSITNNTFNTTGYAFGVGGPTCDYYNHTVTDNTEQGEKILYYFDNDSITIEDQTFGELIVTCSNNITIDNVSVNHDGIVLVITENSTINNSNFTTAELGIHGVFFINSSHNNVTNCRVRTLADGETCVIAFQSSDYNLLYNNVLNVSAASVSSSGFCWHPSSPMNNNWNTTETVGKNIIGGPNLGGNFWTNSLGTGFSDTCTDSDGDYFCDTALNLKGGPGNDTNNIDYLPLANHTNAVWECKTLDIEDEIYFLNQSIEVNGNCFNITANNITLIFLKGKNITGDTTGYGINISGNDTTIEHGVISNFSNGIYIYNSSNNAFTDIRIDWAKQDAIVLEGTESDNNNFTRINVTNTNASYYDINFSTEGIDGTWIENILFANYTFTGTGGKVNFKEPDFGEIRFLQAINGNGTSLRKDVDIENKWAFVNSSSNSGLNKSANISFYEVSFTDPKPQYSLDDSIWVNCTTTTDPACTEFPFTKGGTFTFNVSHFTYFRIIEAYSAEEDGNGGGVTGGSSGMKRMNIAIQGNCKNQPIIIKATFQNKAVEGVHIKVYRNDELLKTLETDSEGKANIILNETGNYELKFTKTRYYYETRTLVVVDCGEAEEEEEVPDEEKPEEEMPPKPSFWQSYWWLILVIVGVIIVAVVYLIIHKKK